MFSMYQLFIVKSGGSLIVLKT